MVRQAFDLLGHPLPSEGVQGLDDAGMEHPPALLQEATVGYLMGEACLNMYSMSGKRRVS
jgi:hypothetical protein